MARYVIAGALIFARVFAGPFSTAAAESPSTARQAPRRVPCEQKYAFVVFYKDDTKARQAVAQVVADEVNKRQDRAAPVYVQITNPFNKAVVDQFAVHRAPVPLIMPVAPNEAITGDTP